MTVMRMRGESQTQAQEIARRERMRERRERVIECCGEEVGKVQVTGETVITVCGECQEITVIE